MANATESGEPHLLDSPEAGSIAVRGGLLRVAGYFAGILLTVGSAALLFRHLGVGDTGRYVTVLALVAIVSGTTDIGLTTIGMRELAVRDAVAGRRLMANLLGLRVVLAAVGVLAVTVFAIAAGYASDMVAGTLLAGIGVVALSVQSTLGIALTVQLRLGWLTLLELARQALLVVGVVTLVVAGARLLPFLAIQVPAALVVLLLTVWLVRGTVPLRPAFRADEWRRLVREVLPFSAATIIGTIYFRAALIVLGLVATEAETGYFAAAFRIIDVLLALPSLIVGAAFPIFSRAARDDRERLAYGVDRVFQAALVAGAGVAVALVIGAPFAIDVVAGENFAPAAGVLRIQAVGLMLSFLATTLYYALLSLRLHRAILVTACVALGVNVALTWWLGRSHGAIGAALATVIAEFGAGVVAATALLRTHRAVFPTLRAVPRVAVAAALAMLVLLVPGLPVVAAAVVGTLVYAGVALALGTVPRELLEAFSGGAGIRRDSR
jgi:O-antigen/teichoic acid export membrane protein